MPQAKVNFGPRVGGAKKTFPPPKKETTAAPAVKLNKIQITTKVSAKAEPVKQEAPPPAKAPEPVKAPEPEPAPAPEPAKPAGKAPNIIEKLEAQYKVDEGKTVIIDCAVGGDPEPDVDWFFNGETVKDEGRFRYLFEKDDVIGLEIRKASPADAGEYKCVCFNKSGKVEMSTKLVVKAEEAPKVEIEVQIPKEVEKPKEEAKAPVVDSAALKKATFTPKKTKKKIKLPVERKGIKAENPEKYYTFGDEIGRGKFSVVKECTSKKNGSKFAAKIIKFDSDSLKFAIREYDLMVGGRLDNKGTVKLHEAYLVRKYLILIMDLVTGKTLLDKVSHMHSLTEDDIADFIRQICEVLHEFTQKNIVHLDIRPTNIRFFAGRDLKILDYNSSRHIANKKAGEVVDVIGDTEFCAPEMINFDPVGPGSDMWSVAVITYILLSGISPFYYEDEDKVLECVQKVKWSFDEDAFASVTSEAKDFIKKCFVRIPENRLTAGDALKHKWLSPEYQANRKRSTLNCQDVMVETDERLYSEEEEDYIEASLVFRTFEEEEYESPEESDDEEED